jgi:hypothetical protein
MGYSVQDESDARGRGSGVGTTIESEILSELRDVYVIEGRRCNIVVGRALGG